MRKTNISLCSNKLLSVKNIYPILETIAYFNQKYVQAQGRGFYLFFSFAGRILLMKIFPMMNRANESNALNLLCNAEEVKDTWMHHF